MSADVTAVVGVASPVHLEGHLDPGLSRWLRLVTWFLALPHFFVLAPLWLAFPILTAVAGIAILVTGRYPRGVVRRDRRHPALDLARRRLHGQRGGDRSVPGTHHRGVFDLVVGLDRWCARVVADAALMADDYPPSLSSASVRGGPAAPCPVRARPPASRRPGAGRGP